MVAHNGLYLANRDGGPSGLGDCGLAYVDRVDVSVVVAVHVAIWQKAIREKRKQDKLRKCKQLIPGERETSAAGFGLATDHISSVHTCGVDKP
jgi:hypothetical protein